MFMFVFFCIYLEFNFFSLNNLMISIMSGSDEKMMFLYVLWEVFSVYVFDMRKK